MGSCGFRKGIVCRLWRWVVQSPILLRTVMRIGLHRCAIFMRAERASYCGSLVDYGCCKTMRKTVPLHVGKCRGGHLQLPMPLKTQIFKGVRRSRCAFRP